MPDYGIKAGNATSLNGLWVTVGAYLVAALAASVWLFVISGLSHPNGFGRVTDWVGMIQGIVGFSILISIFALPGFLVMRHFLLKRRFHHAVGYLLAGAVNGALTATVVVAFTTGFEQAKTWAIPSFAVAGAISGLVYWSLVRQLVNHERRASLSPARSDPGREA